MSSRSGQGAAGTLHLHRWLPGLPSRREKTNSVPKQGYHGMLRSVFLMFSVVFMMCMQWRAKRRTVAQALPVISRNYLPATASDWSDMDASKKVSVLFPKATVALSASKDTLVDVLGTWSVKTKDDCLRIVTLNENETDQAILPHPSPGVAGLIRTVCPAKSTTTKFAEVGGWMKTLPGLAVPVLSAAEASMADDDIVRLLQDDKFYVGRLQKALKEKFSGYESLRHFLTYTASSVKTIEDSEVASCNTVTCLLLYLDDTSPFSACAEATQGADASKPSKASIAKYSTGRIISSIDEAKPFRIKVKEVKDFMSVTDWTQAEEPAKKKRKYAGGNKLFRSGGMSLAVTLDILRSVMRADVAQDPMAVVDPFMGNGTSGVCALALGSYFVGLDGDRDAGDAMKLLLTKTRTHTKKGEETSVWYKGGQLLDARSAAQAAAVASQAKAQEKPVPDEGGEEARKEVGAKTGEDAVEVGGEEEEEEGEEETGGANEEKKTNDVILTHTDATVMPTP